MATLLMMSSLTDRDGVMHRLLISFFVFVVPFGTYYSLQASGASGMKLGVTADPSFVTSSTGLKTQDVTVGSGHAARPGDVVAVHYVGSLDNGTEFDSSRKRGKPFVFDLGRGYVISGWEEGVVGMKPGGVRKLIIPSHLGYGSRDMGSIPPNSTLHFEVELVSVSG